MLLLQWLLRPKPPKPPQINIRFPTALPRIGGDMPFGQTGLGFVAPGAAVGGGGGGLLDTLLTAAPALLTAGAGLLGRGPTTGLGFNLNPSRLDPKTGVLGQLDAGDLAGCPQFFKVTESRVVPRNRIDIDTGDGKFMTYLRATPKSWRVHATGVTGLRSRRHTHRHHHHPR
jgi:hypothetical protein